ncbi:MAG: flagellar export chaperone FliS [Halieaceae bacterium]|nr:flagellar export chaperone FliS [Halieaceae bacterium]
MNANTGLTEYMVTKNESALTDATPHKLIGMLFDGALENLAKATGAITSGDVAVKGEAIGKAMTIVDNLRAMLDSERGGEISANLEQIYDYICRRLLQASSEQDPAILKEVAGLLREVKGGWDSIPPELHGAVE